MNLSKEKLLVTSISKQSHNSHTAHNSQLTTHKNTELKKQLEDANEKLKSKDEEGVNLKNQHQQQMSKLNYEVETVRLEIEKERAKAQELLSTNKELSDDNSKLKTEKIVNQSHSNELQNHVSKLERDLANSNSIGKTAEEKIKELEQKSMKKKYIL